MFLCCRDCSIDIMLSDDATQLDEVVVVGDGRNKTLVRQGEDCRSLN